jgi:phosphatidate cytidylyltransferase
MTDDSEERLHLGSDDSGALPHWTEPPTGDIPRFEREVTEAMPVVDPTGEIDIWAAFAADPEPEPSDAPTMVQERLVEPGWGDTPLFGEVEERREPARISIGTDPTGETAARPQPRERKAPAPTGRTGRNMPVAVTAALVIAAVFLGALLWRPAAVVAFVAVALGLAAVEFFGRVTERGYRPATVAGHVACVTAPLAAYWVGDTALLLLVVFAFLASTIGFLGASGVQAAPMPNTAITMMGVVWIGVLGSYVALLAGVSAQGGALSNVGTDTLVIVIVAVVANDVGALFVGSGIGRTPLRPWISPNKSVEGLVGGTVFTFLAVIVVGVQSDTWNDLPEWLLLGVVISVMAPVGDLVESMFKRNLDVKDFGTLIPGHGGLLDRFDALLFAVPSSYYLLQVLQPWT